ncbi:MAG: DUF927 domain-containing protein [Oscillospiraceae bacterium]|nr:DUF927 domain-containing protein [Oscillospiraceae bacterium]
MDNKILTFESSFEEKYEHALKFLKFVYRGCDQGFIGVTALDTRWTQWFDISRPNALENTAKWGLKWGEKYNTFLNLALRKVGNKNKRGDTSDILSISTLWADIDFLNSGHAKQNLPKDSDEAMEFLKKFELLPSIIVSTGGGLHAYWLLDEPFLMSNTAANLEINKNATTSSLVADENLNSKKSLNEPKIDKNRVANSVTNELLQPFSAKFLKSATQNGWNLDSVFDLPRMMRLPGTFNHKFKEKPVCQMIECSERRYSVSEIQEKLEFGSGNKKIHSYSATAKFSKQQSFYSEKPTVKISEQSLRNIENMIAKCIFMRHCKENAKTLPEPLWYAMITNLVTLKNSESAIHEFSKPYPKYSAAETDEKIRHAFTEDKPHTCSYIKEVLNFDCGKNCNVKSPIVFGLPSFEERFKDFLVKIEAFSEKFNVSAIFSNENMKLCGWAKLNKPSEYAALKLKLKGKVNLKDFEKAVRFELRKKTQISNSSIEQKLKLDGIELRGAVTPKDWIISLKNGVQRIFTSKENEEIHEICPCALVISRRFENIDDGTQKVELCFFRDGYWHSVIASRSHIFNRNSIIKYADSGLPVSSGNASEIIKFLCDYENTNLEKIPLIRSISRMGWVGKEFYPHFVKSEIQFETEYKEATNIMRCTNGSGDFKIWKTYTKKLRENIFGRFLLASSFASPLLKLLGHRVFFVHIWHDSKSGKTAAIKTAISIWGNPMKLMGSFNATAVGLERMAGILKHLPFALDELQVLNSHRQCVENIIYSLGNGFGRLRGAKEGAVQETLNWCNIILTSGEQPICKESSNDGVLTRVLELYGKPCESVDFAHDLHIMSTNHYGFAGKKYIEFLVNLILLHRRKIKKDFEILRGEIKKRSFENSDTAHLDNISTVCLGDYYSSISVFERDEEMAKNEAIWLGVEIFKNTKDFDKSDTTDRAWDFVIGWVISNKNRFLPDSTPCYGRIENDFVYVIPNILRNALEENGFNYGKVTRGFKERGFIETRKNQRNHEIMQIPKRINGIVHKCFVIKEVTNYEINNDENTVNKPL